jgi:hypothetical protein
MHTEIINAAKRKDWEQYIYDNPYSIAWQSYDWSIVLRRHYQIEFYPIATYDNSKICGVLPLYHLSTMRGKEQLMSVPYAVAGGIVADHDQAAQMLLERARVLSGEYNSCLVTFKQYKKKIPGLIRADDNFYNKELDITINADELWRGIEERNKQMVEDAGKYDLKLECPSIDVRGFHKLLLRHHKNRGIPCVGEKWIEDLIAFRMYSIALLRNGNDLVAATMIKEFKDTVSFPFTCIPDITETSLMFAYRLYWQLIVKYAMEGKRIIHSGRIPCTDDVDPYRLGWGGTRYQYYYQYYPDGGKNSEFNAKRGKKRGLMEQIWKRLPSSVTSSLGPRVVKYFP